MVPGTSVLVDLDDPNTFELLPGVPVYGNLFFSVLMIVLSVAGYWLSRRGPRDRHGVPEAA